MSAPAPPVYCLLFISVADLDIDAGPVARGGEEEVEVAVEVRQRPDVLGAEAEHAGHRVHGVHHLTALSQHNIHHFGFSLRDKDYLSKTKNQLLKS